MKRLFAVSMRSAVTALAVIGLAAGLSACGEKAQVVTYKQGKYQGKPDTRPWDNAPLTAEFRGSNWTKGDRDSWETSVKFRQFGQHEDKRIYQ